MLTEDFTVSKWILRLGYPSVYTRVRFYRSCLWYKYIMVYVCAYRRRNDGERGTRQICNSGEGGYDCARKLWLMQSVMWSRSHWENMEGERMKNGKTIGCTDAFENRHVIHHCKKIIHTHTHTEIQIYYEFFYCHTRSRKSLNPLPTVSQPFRPTKVSITVAVKVFIYIYIMYIHIYVWVGLFVPL